MITAPTDDDAPAPPRPEPPPARARLAIWNAASGLLFTGVTLAVALVSTPLLVGRLGRERFGAARTLYDLSGYLALAELGLGGALAALLASALGRGDERALRQTVAAGARAYLKLTPVLLLAGLAATPALGVFVPVAPGLRDDLRLGWFACLAGTLVLALAPARIVAEAGQRSYRVNLVLTAQALLITGLSLALAYAGWGIAGQLLAISAGTTLTALALARDADRRHPGLLRAAWAERPDPEVRRAIRGLGRPTFAFSISGRIAVLTDSIVVSAVVGPKAVASLFVTQRLAVLALGQLQGVGASSWAALAELHARGERALFARRLIELTGLVALFGAAAFGPVVAFNGQFLDLWMADPAVDAGRRVVAVAAFNAPILGVFGLWTWCFSGTGRVGRVVGPFALSAALNLALSLALTRYLGVVGPLLGTTISYLTIQLATVPPRLRRDFGVPTRELARAAIAPMAFGLPYAGALCWLADALPTARRLALGALRPAVGVPAPWLVRLGGLGVLGLEMALAASLFLLVVGRILLGPTDRALWAARLSRLLPRPRAPRDGPAADLAAEDAGVPAP